MVKKKDCCTILGNKLDSRKSWVTNVRKNGKKWVPMFLEYVDGEKCIGCGMCVKVCTGRCYEMKEIEIMGKKKKIAVAVHPESCLGDCSCHLICPIKNAIICKPKLIKN